MCRGGSVPVTYHGREETQVSKLCEIKYDCGYVVVFPVSRTPDRHSRRTFELSADLDHEANCSICREKNTEEELNTQP